MTTLLALYRRPDGGAEALADVRAPLRRGAPAARRGDARACVDDPGPARGGRARRRDGPRARHGHAVRRSRGLDAGLASDAMRAAGRNLREIAPGLATLLVLEDVPEMDRRGFPGRGYCQPRQPREPSDRRRDRRRPRPQPRPLVRVEFPGARPALGGPRRRRSTASRS